MSFWLNLLILLITVLIVLRQWVIPNSLSNLTQIRVSAISLLTLSIKGLEWRPTGRIHSVVPKLRIERTGWYWGGADGVATGWLVLKIDGVSFRMSREEMIDGDAKMESPASPRRSLRLSAFTSKWLARILHLVIHHHSILARLISVQITDIRIIFDDLNGLELTVKDFCLGTKIDFAEVAGIGALSPESSPTFPSPSQQSIDQDEPCERNFPLCQDMADREMSPPGSPGVYSPLNNILSTPWGSPTKSAREDNSSRLSHARRRASVYSSRFSSTASSVWARAIGRAHGTVSLVVTIEDIAVVAPQTASAEAPDVTYGGSSQHNGLSTKSSSRSFDSARDAQQSRYSTFTRTFSSVMGSKSNGSIPAAYVNGGLQYLLKVEGLSTVVFGLGFGPRQGLLGEDTLKAEVAMGKLQTTLQDAERLQGFAKLYKREKPASALVNPAGSPWEPHAMPRIVMRAFESGSLSFAAIDVSHQLPIAKSQPVSTSSSTTDMQLLTPIDKECFTISVHISEVSARLSAADSSNNQRARNAFGTNSSPSSKVRGVAFEFHCQTIVLSSLSPGTARKETDELLSIKEVGIEGLTTWRPRGWTREEMLFANDPNLAFVLLAGSVASIDAAGDVQLLTELGEAYKRSRPIRDISRRAQLPDRHVGLPPRARMVVDIGRASILLADRVSEQRPTLTLQSDGLHFGWFTEFSDISARRRDKASARSAFKQEEELQDRRSAADASTDYAQHDSMLKPQLRRYPTVAPALLHDDLSLRMRMDASTALEPIYMNLMLGNADNGDQKQYHLATIGRMHGTLTGDVLGTVVIAPDGSEQAYLDSESLLCSLDLGVDSGVKVNLWETAVVDALVAMGHAHRGSDDAIENVGEIKQSILNRLPSGISGRLSLGLISIFVGEEDPNKDCKLTLTKGLWLQTNASLEYAYINNATQALPWRHTLSAPARVKLRLPEDITTQALAHYTTLSGHGGQAALFSVTCNDCFVKPIFDGESFVAAGGTSMSHERVQPPQARPEEPYVGWDFRQRESDAIGPSKFANQRLPLEIDKSDQAQRPMIRLNRLRFNWLVKRELATNGIEVKLTGRFGHIWIIADISHAYSALLALDPIRKIAGAWRRTKSASRPRSKLDFSTEITIPGLTAHLEFPLHEQLYVHLATSTIAHRTGTGMLVGSDAALVYVPSIREVGKWEELARFKRFYAKTSPPDIDLAVHVTSEAVRVRIPQAYQLSKLILNITVFLKSVKLLVANIDTGSFAKVKIPGPEGPKKIPQITFDIDHISLQAQDDPIETKLNLIWRVGMHEQQARMVLQEMYDRKLQLLAEVEEPGLGTMHASSDGKHSQPHASKLTNKRTTTLEDAQSRLDHHNARVYVRRFRAAREEQRRREVRANRYMQNLGVDIKLPIEIVASTSSPPLFRARLTGFRLSVGDLGISRSEVINYMGDVSSSPFDDDVEFTLMVPLKLQMTLKEASFRLRDYPLPLVRIQPTQDGTPAFHLGTPFIIAEEIAGDESLVMIPSEIIPADCGRKGASHFTVDIAKTLMPVKTYARPKITISTEKTTEFTWGNSYQPAIQDFMKVVETFSHPPRDLSPRVGFWDKFRLILHWQVTMELAGACHLHLKGSTDPYSVTGLGAGFALSWRGGTKLEIAKGNPQYETIRITAEELLIAIPDLTALHDAEAIGTELNPAKSSGHEVPEISAGDQSLIDRRYTKPCARFLGGVRVGFGFRFERTCRPHSCDRCGPTENLFRRQCRIFDFKRHQDVVLRCAEALEKDEQILGRRPDSYEGFRSDYIHFSVSVVAPLKSDNSGDNSDCKDSDIRNSLHFSPKASYHFLKWWKLFDHAMSLPIRQGKLFPNSPPPSKKFGRSLATIKYRADLAPVYFSHIYSQTSQNLFASGQSESLGMKIRFGSFKGDVHQRAQEQVARHEKLGRTNIVVHKTFYAADLLLQDVRFKGIRAGFTENAKAEVKEVEEMRGLPKASELNDDLICWYNFSDFIDADRRPFDKNPRIELVDLGSCPQIFVSMRKKANLMPPANRRDSDDVDSNGDEYAVIESSKFGHEKSHICYLGAADGVGPTQARVAGGRIQELQDELVKIPNNSNENQANRELIKSRVRTLTRYRDDLASTERRHIDDNTLQPANSESLKEDTQNSEPVTFELTGHVHCPSVHVNNASRNIVVKYFFSSQDRRKEEYTASHASLRSVRDGIQARMHRMKTGLNQDDMVMSTDGSRSGVHADMLDELKAALNDKRASKRFRLLRAEDNHEETLHEPSLGLPVECIAMPKMRFLVLKPQIALRSQADEKAVVLLAVEEVSLQKYNVIDKKGEGSSVDLDVLSRWYVMVKGLQAFYPNEETLRRKHNQQGIPRHLDFLPFEVFLDVRSENTEYDRIVLKTDIGINLDRFNHLRMPRGLEWPVATDDIGDVVTHLRLHQDLTTVTIPRISLHATAKHYAALYNVVTDLLIYQDPQHRQRTDKIDSFLYAFDRKDRDPEKLLVELFQLQHNTRSLSALAKGYEANIDLLSDDGRAELFRIRTDLLELSSELFTVFEAIAVNRARDEARDALKSASRTDIRAGNIAWHMLHDDLKPLIKFNIDYTLFSYLSNKDGSIDTAAVIQDLSALNSNADAIFPEVLVRHASSKTDAQPSKSAFVAMCWSIMAPVGGIAIYRELSVRLHPIRFKLEEKMGRDLVNYIFDGKGKRKQAKEKNGSIMTNGNEAQPARSLRGLEAPSLNRSRSTMSVNSTMTTNGRSLTHPGSDEPNGADSKFTLVPHQDATEMRQRASINKMFVRILFNSTSIVLSYKSDDRKKHKTFSMPDCVDLKFTVPEFIFTQKTWSWEDLFNELKKGIKTAGWAQSRDLFKQVVQRTSLFRSKRTLKSLTGIGDDHQPSRLRYNVDPPTPVMEEPSTPSSNGSSVLSRVLSRSDPNTNIVSRVISRGRSSEPPTLLSGTTVNESEGSLVDEDEERDGHEHGSTSKALKGFFGKLRPKHRLDHTGIHGSTDDLSRGSTTERTRRQGSISSLSGISHNTS